MLNFSPMGLEFKFSDFVLTPLIRNQTETSIHKFPIYFSLSLNRWAFSTGQAEHWRLESGELWPLVDAARKRWGSANHTLRDRIHGIARGRWHLGEGYLHPCQGSQTVWGRTSSRKVPWPPGGTGICLQNQSCEQRGTIIALASVWVHDCQN